MGVSMDVQAGMSMGRWRQEALSGAGGKGLMDMYTQYLDLDTTLLWYRAHYGHASTMGKGSPHGHASTMGKGSPHGHASSL